MFYPLVAAYFEGSEASQRPGALAPASMKCGFRLRIGSSHENPVCTNANSVI